MKVTRLLLVLALSGVGARVSAQTAEEPVLAPMEYGGAPAEGSDPMATSPAAAEPGQEAMDPNPLPAPEAVAAPEAVPQAAPPPSPAPMPAAAPATLEGVEAAAESGEEEEPARCALGELCIGPMLSLGAINPLGVGAHARYGDYFGFGLDYQFIPSLTFSNASASWSLFTVEARVYPFGGAFFLGAGFGYQTFSASASMSDPAGGTITAKGSVDVPALKLGLGFMGKSGFVLGIDLGFNVPLGGTAVEFEGMGANVPTESMAQLRSDINDAANMGINMVPFIPQLNLLRLGYLF